MTPDRRTAKLEVRCTPLEKARIQERAVAAGLKLSDYLRRRALCEPVSGQTAVDGQLEALCAPNAAGELTEARFKQAIIDEARRLGFPTPFSS